MTRCQDPEQVQVFQVPMKELGGAESNLFVDSSQLARSSPSKESKQVKYFELQRTVSLLTLHGLSIVYRR
jgi:hypothetical protein